MITQTLEKVKVTHAYQQSVHYYNYLITDVIDSSGIRFYYSSSPREHDAGILAVGHRVTSYMIIPPGTQNYTIGAVCTGTCINNVRPHE